MSNSFFTFVWFFYIKLRHELDRVRNERDRMLQENSDIGRDKSDADAEKLRLKVCAFGSVSFSFY